MTKTISCRIVLLVMVTLSLPLPSNGQEMASDRYRQEIRVEYRDPDAAERAGIAIEPLYDGHRRAVSCRWDDNWTSDNPKTREVMEEYGIRGTWYLNDREFSPENRPADYLPVARQLLQGGNSIGGHSLTHPFITYFHSHRMFAEMSGVRIAWEAALDRPVLSYAYSFVDLCPSPERNAVLDRTLRTLTRSGFDHVAEYVSFFEGVEMDLELSPIMPPENNPFDAFRSAVDWAYNDEGLTDRHPMISNSMHAWYGTQRLDYSYDELRKRLELLSSLKDVWHCNQNQYAGYRRQFHNASVREIERDGSVVVYELTRPSAISLNDKTPLTLAIRNTDKQSVLSMECENSKVELSDRNQDSVTRMHVFHRDDDTLPISIGHIPNPTNAAFTDRIESDPELPQLAGGLWLEDGTLRLRLRGEDKQGLSRIRVAWRVPLAYQVAETVTHLHTNGSSESSASQKLARSEERDAHWGREHFAAQVDCQLGGVPLRVHLTCQRDGASPDDSLPIDGFAVLGPLPPGDAQTEQLIKTTSEQWSKNGWDEVRWTLPDGKEETWRQDARDGYINQEWLNPEYVRTMGTWDAFSPTYLLRGSVVSPEDRKAKLLMSHRGTCTVFLNGVRIESDELDLNEGENRLLIIYPGCNLGVATQRLSACFIRLADPENGRRYRDIKYKAF